MFKKRLDIKLIAVIVVTLLIGFGIQAFINIKKEHADMYEQTTKKSSLLAGAIIKSIQNNMVEGRADIAHRVFEDLKTGYEIESLEIIKNNGAEAFTDYETINDVIKRLESKGKDADSEALSEIKRFQNIIKDERERGIVRKGKGVREVDQRVKGVLETGKELSYHEARGDKELHVFLKPIFNDGRCYKCHGSEYSLRGVLRITSSMSEINKRVADNRNRILIISLLTILMIGITLRIALKLLVTAPIGKIVETLKAIASGDLTKEVKIESEDEIGELGKWFNRMSKNISLVDIFKRIQDTINQTTTASGQITAIAAQQEKGETDQAASINEITATVEELSSSARQVNERAESVAAQSKDTLKIAHEGQKSVSATIEEMNNIKEKVETIAENILRLSEQAQQIGTIINTVNTISEQTNMLALNASIEAARAGEHGKGFAVVASEVRKLADLSQKSTAKIEALIREIQTATNSTVMATEEGSKSVDAGVKKVLQAGDTITTVITTIKDTVDAFAEITIASRQQSMAIDQVSEAMGDINHRMKQRVAGAHEMQQAAESLNQLGKELQGMVSKYKF
ncbi:MAG: HAMP domain-containing methyl-accepting chemotaxis protein [Nitrospirota bacterium]